MDQLYKILKDGRSCHGGTMTWSLPKDDGTPGDWHEVAGELCLCRVGFHLTDTPEKWHKDGADVYEVEAEDVVGDIGNSYDRKVVARRVRLTRKVHVPTWVFSGYGYGYGYGDGSGYGSSYGSGYGYGSSYGSGDGSGDGYGDGDGSGS